MVKLTKKKWFQASISVIVVAALALALFGFFNDGKDIKTPQDFINELKAKGYRVENVEVKKSPVGWFDSFKGERRVLKVDNINITYFEFENEETAKSASQKISKEGNVVNGAYVTWGNAVHFYQKGNIIALYSGTDFGKLLDLRLIMGKQAAGSSFGRVLIEKYKNKD